MRRIRSGVDAGDGPGQGSRGTRGREAAMGATIFAGLAR
jgi:hypothetical protein